MVGTPAYMSPEQALGRPVDARTDLYSLGIVLYQMVCGKVPFDRPTIGSMILAHATDPPPPLVGAVPDAPPALSALVMQLLEKEPSARPQSALEVAARLDERPRRPAPKRKAGNAPWLLTAGALVVVGGGVAAALALGGGGGGSGPAHAPDASARGAVVAAADAATCSDGERLVEQAKGELKTDGKAALATAEQALKLCPELGDAHNVRGNALQKLGRLDEAESAYLRALSTNPAADAPRFNLGLLQLRRKDASAVTTFTEVLPAPPRQRRGLRGAGAGVRAVGPERGARSPISRRRWAASPTDDDCVARARRAARSARSAATPTRPTARPRRSGPRTSAWSASSPAELLHELVDDRPWRGSKSDCSFTTAASVSRAWALSPRSFSASARE